jgi:hypothetical protein
LAQFSCHREIWHPFPLCFEEVKLAFRHGHHGLVSETGEIPVKVLIVFGANVFGEVVARHQEVGFEEDADGVVKVLEESARSYSEARIHPLTHVSVDRAYQAESVGSNFLLVILFAIRRSPIYE